MVWTLHQRPDPRGGLGRAAAPGSRSVLPGTVFTIPRGPSSCTDEVGRRWRPRRAGETAHPSHVPSARPQQAPGSGSPLCSLKASASLAPCAPRVGRAGRGQHGPDVGAEP